MPISLLDSASSIPNANISNYFKPTPTDEATFHGHLLKGTRSDQPELYKAISYQSEGNKESR